MNPTEREFYPLRDAGNPASGASTRRVLNLRAPRNIGINETEGRAPRPSPRLPQAAPAGFAVPEKKPRTHDYQLGHAVGVRSVNRCGIFLAGYLSGVIVACAAIEIGSKFLAGI